MTKPVGRPRKVQNSKGQWRCSKCWNWKLPDQFYKNSNTANGLSARCKDCMNTYHTGNRKARELEQYELTAREMYPHATAEQVEELVALRKKELEVDAPVAVFVRTQIADVHTRLIMQERREEALDNMPDELGLRVSRGHKPDVTPEPDPANDELPFGTGGWGPPRS